MKMYFNIINIIVCIGFSYGQYSSIEAKFAEKFEVGNYFNNDELNIEKEKSPLLAMILSGIIPGAGEVYMEKWPRAIVFGLIEVFAWTKYFEKQKLGDEYTVDYKLYAQEHWKFEEWTSNYYNWNNPENEYYEYFININEMEYFTINEPGHYLSFSWNGDDEFNKFISTNSEEFGLLYNNYNLEDSLSAVQFVEENNVEIVYNHHFYENIGKYNHFYAGWDDIDEEFISITNNVNGYEEKYAFSPHKYYYQYILRSQANDTYEMAEVALKGILANHVVSMLDALILAKLWNLKNGSFRNYSVNTYYDHRNPWGVGGVTLSIRW